jgi:predicted alpha/beta hydrolase
VKYRNFRDWFDKRLDAAIEAAEKSELDSKLSHSKYVGTSACVQIVCVVSENFMFCAVHM